MCKVPLAYVAEVTSVTQQRVVNGWAGNTVHCRTMIQTPMKGFPHFAVFLEAMRRRGWSLGPVPEQMVYLRCLFVRPCTHTCQIACAPTWLQCVCTAFATHC